MPAVMKAWISASLAATSGSTGTSTPPALRGSGMVRPVLHDAAQGKSQRFARVHKSVFPRRACSDGFWHIGESHDKSAVGVVFQRRVKSVKHRSLLIRTWSSHSVETKLLSDQPHIHWRQIPGLHRRNLSAAFYPDSASPCLYPQRFPARFAGSLASLRKSRRNCSRFTLPLRLPPLKFRTILCDPQPGTG